ncbi:O-antigen ligase family protein [Psychroserpens burtonensis]|nr:O-antigen ligase family protein [Psychroserpens burtonensis]
MSIVKKKQVIDFCFLLFILVLPFELIFSPIAFGLLAFVFLVFGDKKNLFTVIKNHYLASITTLLYAYYVIGMLINGSFDIAKIDAQFFLFVVPLLFVVLNLSIEQIQKAKIVYVWACIAFCLLALLTLGYSLAVNYEHRNDYNFIQTSMYHFHYPYDVLYINSGYIILLFGMGFKRIKYLLATLFFTIIMLSGVRMGVGVFTLITLIYILVNFKKLLNFKTLALMVFIVLLGFVLVKNSRYVNDKYFDTLNKIGFNTNEYVSDIGEEYHKVTLRQKLWSSACDALSQSPNLFFGYGAQGSREPLNDIYTSRNYKIELMNSHNEYLTTLLNGGIFGLFILISVFILSIIISIKSNSIDNLLIVVIIAIAFITESMLERQKGAVFFAVFITLIIIEGKLKLFNSTKTLENQLE